MAINEDEEENVMRTVVENGTKLREPYKFDDTGIVYGEGCLPELRSCFYDCGADFPAGFSGYTEEAVSDFADSLLVESGV